MNGRWNIDPNVIRFKILRCSSFVCLLALKWRERILCCRLRAMRHIHVEIGPNFRFDWNCFHSIFFFLFSFTFRWRVFLIWYSKHAGVFHIYISCHCWQRWETCTSQIGNCNAARAVISFFIDRLCDLYRLF